MKKIMLILLLVSLGVNAWMLRRGSNSRHIAPRVKTPAAVRAITAPHPAPPLGLTVLAKAASSDPATVRDQLRVAGVDESTIRGVIGGILRRQYRERQTAWRIGQIRTAWWRGTSSTLTGVPAPSARALRDEPMQKLLGPDPLDLADAELRYDFLPPEKRRLLAQIDLDYNELQARIEEGQPTANSTTKAESEQEELLHRERQKDVLDALTPAERAEYDLRFSGVAAETKRRFSAMKATEQEFRTIKPMLDALQTKLEAAPKNEDLPATHWALQQQTMDQLVTNLGYDRALDYYWSVDSTGVYGDVLRVLQAANLPRHNAALLFQLSAEASTRAAAVHHDSSLTNEQKRAALLEIQQAAKPQFDALVPPAVQSQLPPRLIDWYTLLGDGRYQLIYGNVTEAGWTLSSPQSVTTPPKAPLPRVALPRPSGG